MLSKEERIIERDKQRLLIYGFNPHFADDFQLINRKEAHDQAIRCYFKNSDRLIQIDLTTLSNLDVLKGFLGISKDLKLTVPHENKGIY